tara:strand:- start:15866 stop:17671 length:1806 start_codon:yes stop_codon:yes gene_type:complete
MANLLHLKASRTKVLNSLPTKDLGNDGDIVISRINGKGVYLCTKAGGVWYTANRMSELSRIDKTPLDITAKKLKIKDIQKSSDTDKFVVSEKNGELRYQGTEEVLDTLDLERLSVDYKTSYCSLGQYTNKEECEANNGTWYYSENDSYDSISSTAENQLLTIGQSIGWLDSEPTLLYDGSTLEIKRNSDYDDNWQTSAQDTLLKLSYDSTNNTTVGVSSGGDLTITPSGGDTTLSSSTLTIGTIAEVGSDTDKILMSDSGVVKYVTGANLRSYIGAGTSSVSALNDLSDVTYSSGDLAISSLDKLLVQVLEFQRDGDPAPYASIVGGAADERTQFTLYEAGGASTDDYINFDVRANGASIFTTNDAAGTGANFTMNIDGTMEIASAGALTLDCADRISIDTTDRCLFLNVGTTFAEIRVDTTSQLILYEQGGSSTNDYFVIATTTAGDTTIATVDAGGAAAHLNIEPDGHVEFDGCGVGFDLVTPTYNASDTDVDFKTGNKQFVTFGSGNIADLNLKFPSTSGNFVLLLKQDGTGSRTVASDGWLAFDSAGNAANGSATVKFPGGTNPTLTTAANHVDIISFFWDADNEIAYGVATLDFQD